MFYKKVKKSYFVVNFFIWMIIKNYWYDIKNIKKLKYFLFDIFLKKVNRNKKRVKMVCLTCSLSFPFVHFCENQS